MNKWNQLTVKSEMLKLNDDIEIRVEGLKFIELGGLGKFQDENDTEGAMEYLLFVTLRKAIPTKMENGEEGMTDDELHAFIKELDGQIGGKIIAKVQELSGIAPSKKAEESEEQNSKQ